MLACTESQVNSLFLCTLLKLACLITLLACLINLLVCSRFTWIFTSSPTCTQACIANIRIINPNNMLRVYLQIFCALFKYFIGLVIFITKLWLLNSLERVWLLPTLLVALSQFKVHRNNRWLSHITKTWCKINPVTKSNKSDTVAY